MFADIELKRPWDGGVNKIKWFDATHVQFHGGRSCARRDIRSFYGDEAAKTLRKAARKAAKGAVS